MILYQERESYGFQIWTVYSEGPSEQNPIKNFGEM